jgi:NADPH:quinone reductase-like Zn-dependent oxidoreductase
MRAFVKANSSEDIVVPAELPVPVPGAGQVLVRMRAVGVGIHDSYYLPPEAGATYPVGIEGAGIVETVGPGVTQYSHGDRVAFVSAMQPKGGTWADYAVVDTSSLILPLPAGLDFVPAAALPVAGNTILRAFASLGRMHAPVSLFIAGGSGAIGTLAIQLARQRGWRAAASASPSNHEYMRSLGAQKAVDYHDSDWPDDIRRWAPGRVDAAMAVQPETTASTMSVVKDGGTVVTVSGDSVAPERGISVRMPDYEADVRAELARMLADVAHGRLHVEIERVYPFAQAPDALARVQTRHVRGKLVLLLDPDR